MKTRYRTQEIKDGLFHTRTVLVLQVFASWPDGPSDMYGMPNYLAGSDWRDATVEDLTTKDEVVQ